MLLYAGVGFEDRKLKDFSGNPHLTTVFSRDTTHDVWVSCFQRASPSRSKRVQQMVMGQNPVPPDPY